MAEVVKSWALTWVTGETYTICVMDDGSTHLDVGVTNGVDTQYQFSLNDWLNVAPEVAQTQAEVAVANQTCPATHPVGTATLTCDLPNGHTQPAFHHDPATGAYWRPPS